MPVKRLIVPTITLLILPVVNFAQSAGVYVDIGPCMAMEEDAERYACYDLLEEQIRAAQTRETELPRVSIQRNTRQPAADVTVSDSSSEDEASVVDFGRETPATTSNRETTARLLDNEDGGQELIDAIVALKEPLPNQWQVTLASGQVWHQINSKRYRLQEGMEIRIYPSPFGGSYRLSATNLNGFIQVRRIQ